MRTPAFGASGLALVLLLTACGPSNGNGDGAATPDRAPQAGVAATADSTLTYEGVLTQGAAGLVAPLSLRQPRGGAPVPLTGELEDELSRLAGATARVSGRWTDRRGGALDVAAYRLLEIDGAEPLVGTLVEGDGGLWLRSDSGETRVIGAPTDLARQVGAYVWLVGERSQDGLRLQSFGIIRP